MTNKITASEQLIETLIKAGVTHFFGIPGGPISPVFDAILQNPNAVLIESRHETSAAFAAADFYKASGKTAAVVVTAGPGATNIVTGVVSAHLERIPMLIICGDVAWSNGGKLLQDSGPSGVAVEELLVNATRKQIRVSKASTAATQGLAALAAAQSELNSGPSLLVVPMQHSRTNVSQINIEFSKVVEATPTPTDDSIEKTISILDNSERPLLVVGAACRKYASTVRDLINTLNIPFVTTPQGKGIINENHPCSLRHGGLAASYWAREYTSLGVDAALILGTDLDDCSIGPTPYIKDGGKLIHVDIDSSVFGRNVNTSLGIVADIKQFSSKLALNAVKNNINLFNSELSEIKLKSPVENILQTGNLITPAQAIIDLQEAANQNATFITDIGEHMLFALHYLNIKESNDFTIHLGLGSMGSGIGGSIGLGIADPNRQVICICGDGGMQMVGMEALVAIKYNLPIVFAVFNDARYNMVYHGYKQVFENEASWNTPPIDFSEWGKSMGMNSKIIKQHGEINSNMLNELSKTKKPILLDIRIDPDVRLVGAGRNEALSHMSIQKE